MRRSHAVVGFWLMHCLGRPAMIDEALADLFARVAAGELRVVVGGTYPLARRAPAPRSTCASAAPPARCCSIQPLSSPRFTLRPLVEDDAAALLELREWIAAGDLDALRARLRAVGVAPLARRRRASGSTGWCSTTRPAGWVQATIRPSAALVAYAVLPARRGRASRPRR